jgi:hypothetical protein
MWGRFTNLRPIGKSACWQWLQRLDQRYRRLRLAALWGSLAGVPSGSGRLVIGLPLVRGKLSPSQVAMPEYFSMSCWGF